jgi:hypothetical protein
MFPIHFQQVTIALREREYSAVLGSLFTHDLPGCNRGSGVRPNRPLRRGELRATGIYKRKGRAASAESPQSLEIQAKSTLP